MAMSETLVVPETPESAEEIVDRLEEGLTMLEVRVTGSSSLADDSTDIVRPREDRDEYQVQPALMGSPHWLDKEELLADLVGKPMYVVEWEDRV